MPVQLTDGISLKLHLFEQVMRALQANKVINEFILVTDDWKAQWSKSEKNEQTFIDVGVTFNGNKIKF